MNRYVADVGYRLELKEEPRVFRPDAECKMLELEAFSSGAYLAVYPRLIFAYLVAPEVIAPRCPRPAADELPR